MADYSITQTVPNVYLDKRGIAVQGYTVYFLLTAYDEIHQVNVPSLDPKIVAAEVSKVKTNRDALAKLGT